MTNVDGNISIFAKWPYAYLEYGLAYYLLRHGIQER